MADTPVPIGSPDDDGGNGRHLYIGNLNYSENDIKALAELAKVDPNLADKVVDQRNAESEREHFSERFGIAAVVLLIGMLIFGVVFITLEAGIVALGMLIALILATALMIRVIVTGEWSETTWFGSMIRGGVSLLGGKPPGDDTQSE